ncbi:MAG: HAMP domain-containing sensor histidine kinase [Bacillota bacterium]
MSRYDTLDAGIEDIAATMGMGVELMVAHMHEARNVIGNIRAALQLELLRRRTAANHCQIDLVEATLCEVEVLEELLRQVMPAPAKQSDSRRKETISLKELLRNTIDRVAYRARLKGVTITPMAKGRIEMCEGKLDLLGSIVFMLADNAVTFAPAEVGEVRIAAGFAAGGELSIEVCDNGPGVEVSPIEKIFRPSFTTRRMGTGMGLYLAKSLTERRFGGKLTYRAKNERGAIFIISIPADVG